MVSTASYSRNDQVTSGDQPSSTAFSLESARLERKSGVTAPSTDADTLPWKVWEAMARTGTPHHRASEAVE